jgi:hypothetical protein
MCLSVIMIIKNGVTNGYPFLESIRSVVEVADEFLISDGYSEDDTYDFLEAAAEQFRNIMLYRDRWHISGHGEVVAAMTNKLADRARCNWIYNIQADEVMHESMLPKIQYLKTLSGSNVNSFGVRFLHFVGDFYHVETKPGYSHAVRLASNIQDIRAVGDGWTFGGGIYPIGMVEEPPLFHFGWVYARNNISKRKHQAKHIHADEKIYQKDYIFCCEIEKDMDEKPEDLVGWQRKMLASRRIRPYEGDYPRVASHLLERGNLTYEPDIKVLKMPALVQHQSQENG